MTRVLLTGATGFIGRHLCTQLDAARYMVRAALRNPEPPPAGAVESAVVGAIGAQTDWSAALDGIDIVLHVAAMAHRPDVTAIEPYLEVNARGTSCLVRAAARAGVKRFVYLSSIKVNGEGADRPYSDRDEPHPCDAYAQSKWLGERHLREVTESGPMQGVVVRAPLVYGPGVRGNFLRLLRWVETGRPIPFGSIHNRRSLVSSWNLCDLLQLLLDHPAATSRVWMVSDGEDLSTAELARRIARAMGRRAHVLAVPGTLLAVAATLTGRKADLARLCGSLTVDSAPAGRELGWSPPVPVTQGIERTVAWHLGGERGTGN